MPTSTFAVTLAALLGWLAPRSSAQDGLVLIAPQPASAATFTLVDEPLQLFAFYYQVPGWSPILIETGATSADGVASVEATLPPALVESLPTVTFFLFTWPPSDPFQVEEGAFTMATNLPAFVHHGDGIYVAGAAVADTGCPPTEPGEVPGDGWCWEPHASITYAPGERCYRRVVSMPSNALHCCYKDGKLSDAQCPPHTDIVGPACGELGTICFYCMPLVIMHLFVDTIPGWLE